MKTVPALLALTLVLAACGSSQTTTATPTGEATSQTISGTVTALSADHQSLTVAGQTLTISASPKIMQALALGVQSGSTKVRVNGDDANELALSVGQHVSVHASGNEATEVDIRKELRGNVTSIDTAAGTLVIAGQTVKVDASTRIELSRQESSVAGPGHTLADLKTGSFAEVSGSRDAAGVLLASSIEVRSSTERHEQGQDDQAELHGVISGLDAAAMTFQANGAAVSYRTATVQGTLANGSEVEAKGSYDAASKTFTATRVEVEHAGEIEDGAPRAGESVRLEDKVTSLDAAARTLVAGAYKVDYSAATVSGTPAVKAEVRVSGKVDAADAHLIHATDVRFRADD